MQPEVKRKWSRKKKIAAVVVGILIVGGIANSGKKDSVEEQPAARRDSSESNQPIEGTATPAKSTSPKDEEQPTSITWVQYMADCGTKAQELNEARTEKTFKAKYKNKVVRWIGIIDSIDSRLLGGYKITLRMNPTESVMFDVLLNKIPESIDVDSFNKGDTIEFIAKIRIQGGALTLHQLEFIGIP